MQNLKMFCICINNQLLDKVKSLNYTPVGLGKDKFNSGWIKDNSGINISEKNKYYGEYTFHYWFWKNELKNITSDDWIGFCANSFRDNSFECIIGTSTPALDSEKAT